MSQQEIDAAEERLYNAFNTGAISAEQLAKGLNDTKKGIDGYSAALKASMQQFQTGLTKLGTGLLGGATNQAQYNEAMNSGADAISKVAMQAGPLGIAFGVLLKVITFGISEVNKLADNLYKANQDLVKSGLAGFDMSALAEQARQFGYGLDQLDNMTALLKNNAQALAQFGGDAVTGAKKLASVSAGLTEMREHFMMMGMSVDDINTSIAAYIKQQTVLGASQRMTDAELRSGAAQYLEQMSRLSKLTGESADALAKQIDHANSFDAFAARMDQLNESGAEGQARAKELQKAYAILASKSQALADNFANQVTGFVGLTDSVDGLFMATSGASVAIANNTKLTGEQMVQQLADRAQENKATVQSLATINAGADVFGKYTDFLALSSQAGGKVLEGYAKADAASKDTEDKTSAAYVRRMRLEMNTRDAMQDLVKAGIVPVTEAMEGLAEIVNTIVHPSTWLSGSKQGVATSGTMVMGSQDAMAAASKYLGREISTAEYSALVKAVHAESSGGKGNQQEQAMIMASILNRARTDSGGIIGALTKKNQFQSVTGTADAPGPSKNYLQGPDGERLKQIEGGAALLANISKNQKDFTAADPKAYGKGTNIGYMKDMLAGGGQVIGGTVFRNGYVGTNPGAGAEASVMGGAQAMANRVLELEKTGKTEEEAIDIAKRQLQVSEEQVALSRKILAAQEKGNQINTTTR